MSINKAINKIRYWDNLTAKWLMRHFYFIFFQIALFIIFLFWFINMFDVIDISFTKTSSIAARALKSQSINTTIIVFLLLLNSFWMLYMFNILQRIYTQLKDINYQAHRIQRQRHKPPQKYS